MIHEAQAIPESVQRFALHGCGGSETSWPHCVSSGRWRSGWWWGLICSIHYNSAWGRIELKFESSNLEAWSARSKLVCDFPSRI